MIIRATDLKRKHIFSKNHPFFMIAKVAESGNYLPVYQSEAVKNYKSYQEFEISMSYLCNSDTQRPLRITFFDKKKTSQFHAIGWVDTNFLTLSETIGQKIDLINKKGKKSGIFIVDKLSVEKVFTFVDYLKSGVQLNLITAIDFTASNKNPSDPTSLHFLGNQGINQYSSCIRAVCEILCPYDTDQLFPIYGFGAKINGQIDHSFPLTFNPQYPCVKGLDGIMHAYHSALTKIEFSGPTLFAPIIRLASSMAHQNYLADRTYTILLIVTDGVINDLQDTTDAIVDAGTIPLSIIIVGVGNADFATMDVLDADDVPLVSRSGKKMVRDLVQFVPFNNFKDLHYSALAANVLEEVPRQLVEWAKLNGIRPNV